ncbi:MAG: hypothetical protein K2H53_04425, partial [Clostridia bacterium]|nr:hypothetical protein [Clostridia bacterium]
MREILNSGVIGNIEIEAQKKIREAIQQRWDKLGLVEGLQGHTKEVVATLYENQAKHLISEATASDNSGSFETVVFPLIRRVFSKLLANDIVSVQAMNLPIGKLFFIKPVTSEREWDYEDVTKISDGDTGRHVGLMGYKRRNRFYDGSEFNAQDKTRRSWEEYNRYGLPDEVVEPVQNDANSTTPEVTRYMKKTLYDLFYNDFLFDNSKGRITIKVGTSSVVSINAAGEYVEAEMGEYPVNSADGSISNVMLQVGGFSSYNAGRLTGPDGNEMDTEAFLASLKVIATEAIEGDDKFTSFAAGESIPFRVVTQKYGAQLVDYGENICDGQGKMYIELDLTKPCKEQGKTINGYIGVNPESLQGKDAGTLFQIAWA